MQPVGFKPAISATERAQTVAFDRAATGIGVSIYPQFKGWQLNANRN